MKKLMCAVAAVAAGVAFADTGITSANVVGYSSQDWMEQGTKFYLMGGQFERTDADPVKLSDIDFAFDKSLVPAYDNKGNYKSSAPVVWIGYSDRDGSLDYYYISVTKSGKTTYGWFHSKNFYDVTIEPGVAFFYRNPMDTAPKFTFSGQIIPESPSSINLKKGVYRMLSCPYPKACKLSDIDFTELDSSIYDYAKGSEAEYLSKGTVIQIPKSNIDTFRTLYYVRVTSKGVSSNVWLEGKNAVDPSTVEIPVGRGFWFRPSDKVEAETGMAVSFTL